MSITINGSTGISGVNGSSTTPAFQGTDTNTGLFYGTDIVGISTGGSERVRVDADGNVQIGTTSSAGSISNTALLTAGKFVSVSGSTGSIANSTATTIVTLSGSTIGLFTITARLVAGAGSPGLYMSSATVLYDGSSGRITANNGTLMSITLSGANIQVSQSSGETQATGIRWSIIWQSVL